MVRICAHFEGGPCSLVWVLPWGLSKLLIFILRKFTNKLNERLQCVWRRIINQWRVVIASSCLKARTLFHLLVEARNTDHGCWATSLAPDPTFRRFKAKQPQFNDYILTVYENICALQLQLSEFTTSVYCKIEKSIHKVFCYTIICTSTVRRL